MRLKAKTDINHKEIMKSFRQLGCMVASLHQLGGGIPDLLVQIMGVTILVEVKQTKKSSYTAAQKEFHQSWKVYTVTCNQDVTELVNLIRASQLS